MYRIAENEGIGQRQSYRRTMKQLFIKQRFAHHPSPKKETAKALRKMKTMAGRIAGVLVRKLQEDKLKRCHEQINLFTKVIYLKPHGKDKICSLPGPVVARIAKGKAHKPFEFGSKVSFAMLPNSNIINGGVNSKGNTYGTKTLKNTLDHCYEITGREFKNPIGERCYPRKKQIGDTKILYTGPPRGKSKYEKPKKRKQGRNMDAIEPVIGHRKQDCRPVQNYLKGYIGE